jgi:glycosyltransferase involved in cell wall biosynthesis
MHRPIRFQVLINSRLRRSEGGRETWAHTFLPALAEALPDANLEIYGIREADSRIPDAESFQHSISARPNVSVEYIDVRRRWYPYFFQMWRGLYIKARNGELPGPDCVLTLGVFEFLMTFMRPYRKAVRIVWLRSIFLNEKAGRIPLGLLPFARWIEALLLRRADLVLSNGEDIADYYRRRGIGVQVVKNGLDLGRWHRGARKMAAPIQVAFIGRLDEIKGIDEFTSVAAEIKCGRHAPDFEFHVAGSGVFQSSDEYRERAECFHSHGTIPNDRMPDFLERMDVCVALTRSSSSGGGAGISNALLEQMASGAVIVAWDSAIFRQVVDASEAYLVPEGDRRALADALVRIGEHPADAIQKAAQAQQKMRDFDIKERVREFLMIVNPHFAPAEA